MANEYISKLKVGTIPYDVRDGSAVHSVTTGTANGTIKVDENAVSIYGLQTGAYTAVTNEISGSELIPTDTAVKTYVQGQISQVAGGVKFKGTVGTGGTVTTLPTNASVGDMYKVITEGDYEGTRAKIGDLFIYTNTQQTTQSKWAHIPSGDEPSGTVTNINTGNGLTGGPITASGTISIKLPQSSGLYADSNGLSVKVVAGSGLKIDGGIEADFNVVQRKLTADTTTIEFNGTNIGVKKDNATIVSGDKGLKVNFNPATLKNGNDGLEVNIATDGALEFNGIMGLDVSVQSQGGLQHNANGSLEADFSIVQKKARIDSSDEHMLVFE